MHRIYLLIFFLFLNTNVYCQSPKYEFRAAWIATIANLDWPSSSKLSPEKQREEFIEILDMLEKANFNCVIVQVRPSSDAFYQSEIEPWSVYLTGKQGTAPKPDYDPMEFMIEQTHARAMEFHAWINPFRLVSVKRASELSKNSVFHKEPSIKIKYADHYILNPGEPKARQYVASVVEELVKKYDIDALHIDDYFYPYAKKGEKLNDLECYKKYGSEYNSAEDFRRASTTNAIELISETIKNIKPDVKFGVSPFGIWRNISQDPLGSQTLGLSNYDDLFADVRLWLEKGWVDYIIPQIYWEIGNSKADFEKILNWWALNSFNANLYIGHALYHLGEKGRFKNYEISEQIKLQRSSSKANGSAFFSTRHLKNNVGGIYDTLRLNYFKKPALIPAIKRDSNKTVSSPVKMGMKKIDDKIFIGWRNDTSNINKVKAFSVYKFLVGEKKLTDTSKNLVKIIPNKDSEIISFSEDCKNVPKNTSYIIKAISSDNIESSDELEFIINI